MVFGYGMSGSSVWCLSRVRVIFCLVDGYLDSCKAQVGNCWVVMKDRQAVFTGEP